MNDWRTRANCKDVDPELFFPEKGNASPLVQEAKKVCAGCCVREQCLEEAVANGERFGIFGGLTAQERRRLNRQRRVSRLDSLKTERRRIVADLTERGYPTAIVAANLAVSENIVWNDLKILGLSPNRERHWSDEACGVTPQTVHTLPGFSPEHGSDQRSTA